MKTHKQLPSADQMAVADYYATIEFDAVVDGSNVRVVSKAGLSHDAEVSAATRLLASATETSTAARILVLGCGQGALGSCTGTACTDGGYRRA